MGAGAGSEAEFHGAVAEVFGSGKIPRYRHLAYEWLGVGKEELAIMGELLLRGEQTEGDLRGRAVRTPVQASHLRAKECLPRD